MSGRFVLVDLGQAGTGLLGDVLRARGRGVEVVTDPASLPTSTEGVRGLAVLPGSDGPGLQGLIAACDAGDVPVLGVGSGALRVAGAAGLATIEGEQSTAALTMVTATDPGTGDPVIATMPSGSWWLVDVAADVSPLGPETVLAQDADGAPVVLARGRCYAVMMRADLDGPAIEAAVGADAVPPRVGRFLTGYAAALLGRWVDLVVGRSEEEMPWGRRGPRPEPRPGLVLNPL